MSTKKPHPGSTQPAFPKNNQGLIAIRILLLEGFRSEPEANETDARRVARERSDEACVDKAMGILTQTKSKNSRFEELMIDIASQLPTADDEPEHMALTTAVRTSLAAASRNNQNYRRTENNEHSTVKRRIKQFRSFKARLAAQEPLDPILFEAVLKILNAFRRRVRKRPKPIRQARRKVSKN